MASTIIWRCPNLQVTAGCSMIKEEQTSKKVKDLSTHDDAVARCGRENTTKLLGINAAIFARSNVAQMSILRRYRNALTFDYLNGVKPPYFPPVSILLLRWGGVRCS
jgi:hypothetical protein